MKAVWRLIPDGSDTICQITIISEFVLATEPDVAKVAEDLVVKLIARQTATSEEHVRGAINEFNWLGEMDRPQEPTP